MESITDDLVLVTFATRYGSTAETAQAVAQTCENAASRLNCSRSVASPRWSVILRSCLEPYSTWADCTRMRAGSFPLSVAP